MRYLQNGGPPIVREERRPILKKRRILFVLTAAPAVPRMMRGQCRYWETRGYEVTVASGPGADLTDFGRTERVRTEAVGLTRRPSIGADVRALIQLWRLMRRLRPDVVEAGTPKAGLLGLLAARTAGVPVVIYTLHGLRAETTRGMLRWFLLFCERLVSGLADETICVGEGLRRKAWELGALRPGTSVVLGSGSANGVDAKRLKPVPTRGPEHPPVIGFVGRFTADKGIRELLTAFTSLKKRFPALRLLLVGDVEPGDPPSDSDQRLIAGREDIETPGFVDDASPYYAAMDVLALPSHREGLPQVPLEAAACCRPTAATRATGCDDAVKDGVTGLLTPVGDAEALAESLARLLSDAALRERMGIAARARVERDFRPADLWERKAALAERLLERARRPRWERAAKRAIDVIAAAALLAATAPVLGAAALLIRRRMGRPVIFRQTRPGLDERPFEVLKLRTMRDACDPRGVPLPDEERLTRLGRLLRRWSVDELPQLVNVLRGEMSLVGPRPLLSDYLPRYSDRQRRRHWVRPGITGWAQIHGRNALSWQRRFELDLWYLRNRSLWLDLRVLATTALRVMSGSGVAAATGATPAPFEGQNAAGEGASI